MRAWTASIIILLLGLVVPTFAEDLALGISLGGQEYDVVGQVVGNEKAILVHVGLGDPNTGASWGLAVSHEPQMGIDEQGTSFGAFAQLQTDLIAIGSVPDPYQSLDVKGFIGCDVLYDFDHDRIQVWPTLGARIAPQETMAFLAMMVYPLGDESYPSALDLNSPTGLFGLELRF